MDVPAIAWYNSPGGPAATSVGVGVLPARIWTPGAVTSGLRNSPTGPRELNAAITSPGDTVASPRAHVAVASGCSARNATTSSLGPSSWIAGRKWLSVCRSIGSGLARIMPAAPPSEAL